MARLYPVITELINGRGADLSNHQTQRFQLYKKKYGVQ